MATYIKTGSKSSSTRTEINFKATPVAQNQPKPTKIRNEKSKSRS